MTQPDKPTGPRRPTPRRPVSSFWVLAALLIILAFINGVSSFLGQGQEIQ